MILWSLFICVCSKKLVWINEEWYSHSCGVRSVLLPVKNLDNCFQNHRWAQVHQWLPSKPCFCRTRQTAQSQHREKLFLIEVLYLCIKHLQLWYFSRPDCIQKKLKVSSWNLHLQNTNVASKVGDWSVPVHFIAKLTSTWVSWNGDVLQVVARRADVWEARPDYGWAVHVHSHSLAPGKLSKNSVGVCWNTVSLWAELPWKRFWGETETSTVPCFLPGLEISESQPFIFL